MISCAITSLGGRQLLGVLKRFVPEPGDVEARLVPRHEHVVAEPAEPLGLGPSCAVFR